MRHDVVAGEAAAGEARATTARGAIARVSTARILTSLGVAALLLAAVAGCGTGEGSAAPGEVLVRWYDEPANDQHAEAAARCNQAAAGRYRIQIVALPNDASQQREQLVRRLAADDHDIDLISMDVIWTAEFAEAGWVKAWPADQAKAVSEGVFPSVLATATYDDQLYAAPLNSGTQLLWYRKDLVPQAPTTWDEMIQMAQALPPGQNKIQVQGRRYEGLTVWFNSLLASAGGSIIGDQPDQVSLDPGPTTKALTIMHDLATSSAADSSLSNIAEDEGRLAFQSGSSAFMVNYPFVYPSIRDDAPDLFANLGVAPWPRVDPNEPSHVSLGGFNLGVSSGSRHSAETFDAAICLRSPENQIIAAGGGLPPVLPELFDDPKVLEEFPYADLLRQGIETGSTRPASPAYNDISLAVQRVVHPPANINPTSAAETLRSRVDDALNSRGLQ